MPTYWSTKLFSVGFADQAAYSAKDNAPSYTYLVCEMPDISFNREIEELELGLDSDGVAPQKVVGSTHGGTFTIRMPLRGQASGYDATGTMTETPEIKLLKELVGTKLDESYVSDDGTTANSDANSIGTIGAVTAGAFAVYGEAGTKTIHATGFVKSQAAGVATLFEDSIISQVTDDSDRLPSMTLYPNGGQPTAKTFTIKGSDSTQSISLIGCIPESGSISLESGKVPMLEITYRFTAYEYDTSDGGLQSATAFTRLSPVLGTSKGRVWIGGGNAAGDATGASTGSAQTEGTCGVGSFKLDIALDVYEIPCHGASQGVSTVYVSKRNFTTSFTVPQVSTHVDGTTKDSIWGVSLAQEKGYSVSMQVGAQVGSIFAILIPSAVVTSQPGWGEVEGVQGFTLEMQPQDWSGDTGSAPANTPIRIAFA